MSLGVILVGLVAAFLAFRFVAGMVKFLVTQVIEVFVGENATFDFYELEETHNNTVRFSNLYVHQKAGSNVAAYFGRPDSLCTAAL